MTDLISIAEGARGGSWRPSPGLGTRTSARRALGRVLAEDVTSAIDVPPFDSSAMDGYARGGGAEAELEVDGEARAGHPAPEARRAARRRISTGAACPEGADAVVRRLEGRDGEDA